MKKGSNYIPLSECIYDIYQGEPPSFNPILQVIDIKISDEGTFSFLLSDKKCYANTFFSSQLIDQYKCGNIKKYSILEVIKFIFNKNNANNLIVLEAKVISNDITSIIKSTPSVENLLISNLNSYFEAKPPNPARTFQQPTYSSPLIKIKDINGYTKSLCIEGRIVSIEDIKNYKSDKSSGCFASFTIMDENGDQIKCIIFNSCISKTELVRNYVYVLDDVTAKFNDHNHNYEIKIDYMSTITNIQDNGTIGHLQYNFTKFNEIEGKTTIDIIGVVTKCDEIKEEKNKENIVLSMNLEICDETNTTRTIIVYGNIVTTFPKNTIFVLMAKDAKVNSNSIECRSNIIDLNPKLNETKNLLIWWYTKGCKTIQKQLCKSNENIITLADLNKISEEDIQKGVTFISKVFIIEIIHKKNFLLVFPSCPCDRCNGKQLVKRGDLYYCKNSGYQMTPDFKWKFNFRAADHTGSAEFSVFGKRNVGRTFFNMEPKQLYEIIKNMNETEKNNYLSQFLFKNIIIKACLKIDRYTNYPIIEILEANSVNFKKEELTKL